MVQSKLAEGKVAESKVAESKVVEDKLAQSTPPADHVIHRRAHSDYRWDGVEQLPYKEDDRALFKSITRQVLFSDAELRSELRYFEVAAGGFWTLERHEHVHAVLILRGRGRCLVGGEVKALETRDLVTVPPLTWHQFRATKGEPLGFLCMVNTLRDKPQLPTAEDLARLTADPAIAEFLRNEPSGL
jgi:mannose-6-phosphate isomerase-like protein (cupin superfamily)